MNKGLKASWSVILFSIALGTVTDTLAGQIMVVVLGFLGMIAGFYFILEED